MRNKTSEAQNVLAIPGQETGLESTIDIAVMSQDGANSPRGCKRPKARCANPPCGKLFTPTKQRGRWQEYCSQRCGVMHREQRQPDVHERAGETNRARRARLAAEAAEAGITLDAAFDAKVEAYWRKVADPDYYRGIRGAVTLRSALGGL